MKKLLSIIAFLLMVSATQVYAQSFKVIVNETNATETLTKKEVSEIFLKTMKKWADGSEVVPVDLNARSQTRATFSQEVHGRGVGAIRSYWQQAAFSGAGTAPLERSDDAEVIAFVKANAGAIGYIAADTDAAGVKEVSVN